MKKILLALTALLTSLGIQAQGNPKIDSLVSRLKAQGAHPDICYSYDGKRKKTISANVHLFNDVIPAAQTSDERRNTINAQADSFLQARNRQDKMVFQTLKDAYKPFVGDAAECYLWEYHRNGVDSIRYSMALGAYATGSDSLYSSTYKRDVYYYNAPEMLTFYYNSNPNVRPNDSWDIKGFGWFNYVYSADSVQGKRTYIDKEDYIRHIERILKQKGVERYPLHLSHDSTCTIGTQNEEMILSAESKSPRQPKSETKGTIYTIRSAALADSILHQLVAATWQYLDAHPTVCYGDFRAESRFQNRTLTTLFCSEQLTRQYEEIRVLIHCLTDTEYNILVLHTTGDLWLPKEWAILKSWENGKATYNKRGKEISLEKARLHATGSRKVSRHYTVTDENANIIREKEHREIKVVLE